MPPIHPPPRVPARCIDAGRGADSFNRSHPLPPLPPSQAVLVHQLSRGASQNPFRKNRGRVVRVLFHPSKPFFFVATQQNVSECRLGRGTRVGCLASHPYNPRCYGFVRLAKHCDSNSRWPTLLLALPFDPASYQQPLSTPPHANHAPRSPPPRRSACTTWPSRRWPRSWWRGRG